MIECARPLWDDLRGERIFVTGGTGFVGTWLLEAIAHANDQLGVGCKLVVLTRDPDTFASRSPHLTGRGDLTLHRGDVRNFELPPSEFGFVIHGATESGALQQGADRRRLASTIIDGTARARSTLP